MKILFCGMNFFPELVGIGKYSGETVAWLTARGHRVHVVTAPPYYPQWAVAAGYRSYLYQREYILGATVWRCPLWVPKRATAMRRVLHLLSFAFSSLPVLFAHIAWRPRAVIAVEPPLYAALGTWSVARLSGAKAWLHVQDFEVDAAFDLGIVKAAGLRRAVMRYESWLMGRFDSVSTISPKMLTRLADKGVKDCKRVSFPNWVDTELIRPLKGENAFREALDIPVGTTVALYSGNIGLKQGFETVVAAARILKGLPGLVFVFCGEGAGFADVRAMAVGLTNVRWLPLQPIEQLNALLNLADIHLLPQRADAADLVMPSKLTGMFASGRPVVATALPGTQVWAAVQGRGRTVAPGDSPALATALVELANAPDLRAVLGTAARGYALEHFAKEAVLAAFEKELLS